MVTSESTAAQNVNLTKVLGVIISEKFFFFYLYFAAESYTLGL